MISNRVMKQDEYGHAVWYRVACDCGSKDCDLSLELEYDKELAMVFLNMYKDLHWSSHWVDRDEPGWWWKSKWLRLKTALRILFIGYIKVEECLIIGGDGHIEAFIGALQEGQRKLEVSYGKQRA